MNLFKFVESLYIANQSASFERRRILTTPYEVGRNQVLSGDKKMSGKTLRRTSIQVFRSNSRIKSLQNYIITQIIVQKMMNLLYNCIVFQENLRAENLPHESKICKETKSIQS